MRMVADCLTMKFGWSAEAKATETQAIRCVEGDWQTDCLCARIVSENYFVLREKLNFLLNYDNKLIISSTLRIHIEIDKLCSFDVTILDRFSSCAVQNSIKVYEISTKMVCEIGVHHIYRYLLLWFTTFVIQHKRGITMII